MNVSLNGEPRVIDDGACVADAASHAGIDDGERGVAIAVDGLVIPRSRWAQTPLVEGQRIEVVRATAGG